jgi:hypothetical protein
MQNAKMLLDTSAGNTRHLRNNRGKDSPCMTFTRPRSILITDAGMRERARQPGWTSPGRGEGGAVAGARKQVAGVAGDEEWGGLAGHRAKVASQTRPLEDCQLPTMQRKVAPQFVFLLAAMMKPA